jgi:hypothetical protein
MNKFLSKFFLGVFALSLVATTLTSCGGDDEAEENEDDKEAEE